LLRNAGSGHDSTEAHRDAYFKKYEKKYKKALATPISDGVALQRRVRTLMNMQPTATYAWGVGYATRAEMAGKGEREDAVLSDMESIAKGRKDTLTTVDFGFESHFPAPLAAAAKRNVEDIGLVQAARRRGP
jgi:hypothetical protein